MIGPKIFSNDITIFTRSVFIYWLFLFDFFSLSAYFRQGRFPPALVPVLMIFYSPCVISSSPPGIFLLLALFIRTLACFHVGYFSFWRGRSLIWLLYISCLLYFSSLVHVVHSTRSLTVFPGGRFRLIPKHLHRVY